MYGFVFFLCEYDKAIEINLIHFVFSLFFFIFPQSNSSIDSIDQLPFANDNAGTIKQRVNQYNQMHSTPNVSLDESQSKSATADNTPTNLSSATSPCRNDANDTSQNQHASVSVLNDIGNMLANLTDELDAMLEEEKRVGLNDSE